MSGRRARTKRAGADGGEMGPARTKRRAASRTAKPAVEPPTPADAAGDPPVARDTPAPQGDAIRDAIAGLRRAPGPQAEPDPAPIEGDAGLELMRAVEALLFAAHEPLDLETLRARLPDGADVSAALGALQLQYASRGVNLARVAGKWRFQTAPDLRWLLDRTETTPRKLAPAARETLAIIAYHQPATRAEIEAVRGVAVSRGTLDTLLEVGWVRPRGRRRAPGRPVVYATTDAFLEHFGLDSLEDLPGKDELKAAGLLDARVPADVDVPDPATIGVQDELDLEEVTGEAAAFHQDFLSSDELGPDELGHETLDPDEPDAN